MVEPASIPAETVVEQTAKAIRDAIREGRFAPGQRLILGEISRLFGVSGGPAREAISRLAGERLVDIVPHRGAVVRTFTVTDVRDIFAIREVVEGLTARLAATAISKSPEKQFRIKACIAEMHEIIAARSTAYIEHNQQFHAMIYEFGDNRRAKEIAELLVMPIYRLRYHHLMERDYARVSGGEHVAIAEALLSGDCDRAECEMREHIRNSGRAMIAAIEEKQGHRAAAMSVR